MKLSLIDLRVWALFVVFGLAASLWVVSTEKGAAMARAKAAEVQLRDTRADLDARELDLVQARAAAERARENLGAFAEASIVAFEKQAADTARVAAELAELKRRVTATQQEISRADAGLRLDDPLPRGVRDGLACAGGDAAACTPAAATPPGVVPGGAVDAGRTAGAPARGAAGA